MNTCRYLIYRCTYISIFRDVRIYSYRCKHTGLLTWVSESEVAGIEPVKKKINISLNASLMSVKMGMFIPIDFVF